MDLFLTLLIVIVLVIFSALCSGLNIALMSLNLDDLKRKAKIGNNAAARVLPLRRRTHLALTSILLTNVATISATSLVLENYFNGIIAGVISTLLIVIFGEILPQAIFSKHPLAWTSRLSIVLRGMMIVAYPAAKPLEYLLDAVVGHAPRKLHDRQELGVLITEHLGESASELDEDEVEIIRGALRLSEKRIRDIMTPIEDVYWLTPDSKLNEKRLKEIKAKSYSRIPVLNKDLTACFGVILMKDLVDIDFDENNYRVSDLPLHITKPIGPRTALDTAFRKFIGSQSHLLPIEADDQIIGIVTIEDLIEEILGHEIVDETDRRKNRA